jgi:hypothetical protein
MRFGTLNPKEVEKRKGLLKDNPGIKFNSPPKSFPIHTVSADLRHFYHQIPLPHELRHQSGVENAASCFPLPGPWALHLLLEPLKPLLGQFCSLVSKIT